VRRNTRSESLSARVSAANLATERKVLDEWIPADTCRPVYSAIRNAFIEQFSVLYVLLMEKTRNTMPEPMPPELTQLDKNCTTLAGLLFSRSNVWAARDWRKPPILKFLLRCLGRSKGGRPLTRLGIAAQAEELRVADPKRWKWPQLTAKFCDCGKSEHPISCRDNLRREVLHLEKLLRSCGHSVKPRKTR
jgi:hypothetical protein